MVSPRPVPIALPTVPPCAAAVMQATRLTRLARLAEVSTSLHSSITPLHVSTMCQQPLANQCLCFWGVPKTGIDCPNNDEHMCASCEKGYTMSADGTACFGKCIHVSHPPELHVLTVCQTMTSKPLHVCQRCRQERYPMSRNGYPNVQQLFVRLHDEWGGHGLHK